MSRPIVERPGAGGSAALLRRFAADVRGATAIEYALIAGLIFVVVVGSLRLYASKVNGVYLNIGNVIGQD